MNADHRIAVTKTTWEKLHGMRKAGQTFDALLNELMETAQEFLLIRTLEATEVDAEFVGIEEAERLCNAQ